ncbi:unnamed protein product [Nippostrongylus brasiliensis]|uniref:Uncharacterized protein n=1 Tax=Nippostrongylus brasiliensis TaxID=27835 RepID=A0A0N4XQU7_NIPBR|nr:unnamed protein product [Nippostrongylus brasiliensis]
MAATVSPEAKSMKKFLTSNLSGMVCTVRNLGSWCLPGDSEGDKYFKFAFPLYKYSTKLDVKIDGMADKRQPFCVECPSPDTNLAEIIVFVISSSTGAERSRERIDLTDGDSSLRINRTLSRSSDIVCRTKPFTAAERMAKDVGSELKVSLACA